MDDPDNLAPETRPRAYAGVALLLELAYIVRDVTGLDYEDMFLWAAVNVAVMRPLVMGPYAVELSTLATPPNDERGYVSRLHLSEITGLPRETVRRKINDMIKSGLMEEDGFGQVRTTRMLHEPRFQQAADEAFKAVVRFDRQLRALGCRGIGD